MTATTGFIGMLQHLQVAKVNASGYPVGNAADPLSISAGTTLSAYKVKGAASITAPSPTYSTITRKAGGQVLGQMEAGLSEIGTFELVLSDYDETFMSMITGSVVDTSTSSTNIATASNVRRASRPQLSMIATAAFQTDAGLNQYLNIMYPLVTISPTFPGATQSDGENPNAMSFTVTPTTSLRTGWGLLFANTTLAVQDNTDMYVAYRSTKPLGLTTYVAAGAATSFTTGYRPTSAVVDGSTNMISLNGTNGAAEMTAISTTTGAVTIDAATGSDIYVIAYPTDFISI